MILRRKVIGVKPYRIKASLGDCWIFSLACIALGLKPVAQMNSHGIQISMPIILYSYSLKIFRFPGELNGRLASILSYFLINMSCAISCPRAGRKAHCTMRTSAWVLSWEACMPNVPLALLKLLKPDHEHLQPHEFYGSFYFSKLVTALLLVPCAFPEFCHSLIKK